MDKEDVVFVYNGILLEPEWLKSLKSKIHPHGSHHVTTVKSEPVQSRSACRAPTLWQEDGHLVLQSAGSGGCKDNHNAAHSQGGAAETGGKVAAPVT